MEKATFISERGPLSMPPTTYSPTPSRAIESTEHGLSLRRLEGVNARPLRAEAFWRNPERCLRRISPHHLRQNLAMHRSCARCGFKSLSCRSNCFWTSVVLATTIQYSSWLMWTK